MPTVSVIIPTYDRADVLPRAMESVLDQSLSDLELIVVDDGSTDGTEALVTGYDDDRVTYLAHERNRGGSAARNTGIERATGDYIAFLDSDDSWHPAKLRRQVDLLESRSEEWVAAYCGVERVFPDRLGRLKRRVAGILTGSGSGSVEHPEGGSELIGDVLCDSLHTSAGSTLLVRREVVAEIDGFDESFDRFQDPEFLIRVLREGKLACVDAPLVERYESGDPPADAVREANDHYLATFAETVADLERRGRDVTGAHHLILAKLFLREGRFVAGFRYLRSARTPTTRQVPGLALVVCAGLTRRLDA